MLNLNYGFKHPVRRVTPISPSPREWTREQVRLFQAAKEPGLAGAVAVVKHESGQSTGDSASPYIVCGRVGMMLA